MASSSLQDRLAHCKRIFLLSFESDAEGNFTMLSALTMSSSGHGEHRFHAVKEDGGKFSIDGGSNHKSLYSTQDALMDFLSRHKCLVTNGSVLAVVRNRAFLRDHIDFNDNFGILMKDAMDFREVEADSDVGEANVGLSVGTEEQIGNLAEVIRQVSRNRRESMTLIGSQISVSPHPIHHLEYTRGPGLVVVFSIRKFKDLDERHGTEKDVWTITNTFQALGHAFLAYEDVTKAEDIQEKLVEVRETVAKKEPAYSFLCVFMLTHGNSLEVSKVGQGRVDFLYDSEGKHMTPYEDFVLPFNSQLCPALRDRPKLFIFQACRGLSRNATAQHDSNMFNSPSYSQELLDQAVTLPTVCDYVIVRSNVPNALSFRSAAGSYLVQTLCHEMEKYHHDTDFLRLMTHVNHKLSSKPIPVDKGKGKSKAHQVIEVTSTLTRLLYLDGNNVLVESEENTVDS